MNVENLYHETGDRVTYVTDLSPHQKSLSLPSHVYTTLERQRLYQAEVIADLHKFMNS